jgi:hypothetical protein
LSFDKPEGKRLFEKTRRRREGNIKMDLREQVGGSGLNHSSSRQGPVVDSFDNCNGPSSSVKGGEFIR